MQDCLMSNAEPSRVCGHMTSDSPAMGLACAEGPPYAEADLLNPAALVHCTIAIVINAVAQLLSPGEN